MYLTKKNICFAVIFILFILSFCFNITFKSIRIGIRDGIRNKYFFNYEKAIWLPKKLLKKTLPTKSIQLDDIKYVKVINLDTAKDRRQYYEKMLHHYFGETFLGKKIGDEIRLKGVYGKKDVEFVNLDTGEVWDYDKIVKKNGGKWTWQASRDVFGLDTKWIGRVKNNKNIYIKFSPMDIKSPAKVNVYKNFYYAIFGKFGCHLSHLKAIQEIAKLPAGSWGIVFEDDFEVNKWFHKDFKENILENIPEDAEMLKLVIKPEHFKNNACYRQNKTNIYRSFLNKGYGKWNDLAEADKMVQCNVNTNGVNMISQEGAKKIADFYKNNFALNAHGNDYEFFWLMPKDKRIKLRSYQYLPKKRVVWLSSLNDKSIIYDYGK